MNWSCSWESPLEGNFKSNVDGAVFFDLKKIVISFIVKDNKGEVLIAASIPKSSIVNPEFIKALAILRRLQLCMHQRISSLVIESDCLQVVEKIVQQEAPSSAIGNILMDIKKSMSHFTDCILQYGNRTSYEIAYKLVQNDWHVNHVAMWYGEMPFF